MLQLLALNRSWILWRKSKTAFADARNPENALAMRRYMRDRFAVREASRRMTRSLV
jgi:hypothetical protein